MAIIFSEQLDADRLLNAYNNNVVRFTSDTPDKVIVKAEITGFGFSSIIYPNPNGSFYFNFKEYFSVAVNTKNFVDDIDYELDILDEGSISYDVADGHFLKDDINYKIIFDDATEETETITQSIIACATQLQTFKQDLILIEDQQVIPLIPAADRTQLVNLKVWRGYPFEFTVFASDPTLEISMYNDTNIDGFSFFPDSELTSLVLTDGQNEFPFVGLTEGWNKFHFENDGYEKYNLLNILFDTSMECGVYVKFLNRFGRWTYWLFSKNFFENRSSKYMGEIDNDFENIENTMSPTLQIGKISDSSMKVAAKLVPPEFSILLEDIFDSPKIMIFTGTPGEVSTYRDWYETRLKTTSFQTKAPNKKVKNFYLEFDNPLRNTITL